MSRQIRYDALVNKDLRIKRHTFVTDKLPNAYCLQSLSADSPVVFLLFLLNIAVSCRLFLFSQSTARSGRTSA